VSESVKIVEVGPRDGLQNEKKNWSVEDRLELLRKLIGAGLRYLEGGSLVSPKAVPQMQGSEDVWVQLRGEAKASQVDLSFLVANQKGFDRAVDAGIVSLALFSATSSSFTQKNIGMTVEESLVRFKELAKQAKAQQLRIRGYVSTVFGCPYEGKQEPAKGIEIIRQLFEMGCDEVSVGDTIGVAHPRQIRDFFTTAASEFDISRIAAHLHDTRGMALTNILVALERGVRIFDSSVGGLGGCPYAPGSSGNVATEEVVYLLEGEGFKTGIDLKKLLDVSAWVESKLDRGLKSKFYLSKPSQFYYDVG
jgi:hydroxymethylglutaryl-CoA lyase